MPLSGAFDFRPNVVLEAYYECRGSIRYNPQCNHAAARKLELSSGASVWSLSTTPHDMRGIWYYFSQVDAATQRCAYTYRFIVDTALTVRKVSKGIITPLNSSTKFLRVSTSFHALLASKDSLMMIRDGLFTKLPVSDLTRLWYPEPPNAPTGCCWIVRGGDSCSVCSGNL
ncbi:hypothetical protein PM082_021330 [Marasmius tenuissimus]|nr:hypothetical protein PM082_021330 [Marasmius tenuissimus]